MSGFIYYGRVLKNNAWNSADSLYAAAAQWVAGEAPAATVMINNPPAYRYHGGGLSVAVPNESLAVTLQVARRYGADYLVLDPNHPAPLAEVYAQPRGRSELLLVKTFAEDTGGEVYVFKIVRP